MTAASTTNCSTINNDSADSISKSYFQKTVCLKNWWLVKAENDRKAKRLSVAGITSREKQALRVFSSAPIWRRHDVFTLETVDGICIILKGFLDKARMEENGFPSEVCNHFVFGFPPYWETFAFNCFGGEPLSVGAAPSITDSGRLSPQQGIAPEASQRVASPRDSLVENMKIVEMSENSPGNIACQPLVPSGLEENDVHLSEQNNANDQQKDKDDSSPLILRNSSACERKICVSPSHSKEIKDYNFSSKAVEEPRKVGTRKKSSGKTESRKEIGWADDIADYFEGSRSTRSLSKLLRKWNDNPSGQMLQSNPQSSFLITRVSGCEENAIPNNVKDSRARSLSSLPVTELQGLGDEMILSTPDFKSTDDDSGQKHGISSTDEGINGDQNNKRFSTKARKSNKELHSSGGFCKAENRRKNYTGSCEENIFQHTDFHGKKSGKTRVSCTSWKANNESVSSPESLSLNRSRSGRLLLPTLEFWRNQIAIYDADRQITGIKDLQVNEPSKGSRSEPQSKRRHLQ